MRVEGRRSDYSFRTARARAAASRRRAHLMRQVVPPAAQNQVTSATAVAAGAFTPPTAAPGRGVPPALARAMASAPAFCRVELTSKPTADSDIKIEVWLPASGWNGKLQAVGNGGWAGTISYQPLAAAVALGYAAASTDSGHTTAGASFAVGHPEKLADYAHRSLHELAVRAKAVVGAYYGKEPAASLWNGCSTGGNQGLTLASMYPADFDAYYRGRSAGDVRSRVHAVRLVLHRIVHRSPGSYIPPEKYPAIHQAGTRRVRFERWRQRRRHRKSPVVPFRSEGDQCSGGTARHVSQQSKSKRRGPCTRTSSIRRQGKCSTLRSSSRVPNCCGEPSRDRSRFRTRPRHQDLVAKDEGWDSSRFDAASDVEKMDSAAAVLNTAGDNLKPFFSRGGKLLMYHGWSDQQNPASTSVSYFGRVVKDAGKSAVGKSIQLYMVPGMTHCQGGVGTDTFDKVAAIEEWMAKAPRLRRSWRRI